MDSRVKLSLIVSILLLPPGGLLIYGYLKSLGQETSDNGKDYRTVDWRTLSELDHKTGKRTANIDSINGRSVKIPGFVVPLDDDAGVGAEFLLVPSPQACIHVPPPPPNQMVMVTMVAGTPPQRSWGPVWVKGKLLVGKTDSPYGKVSYKLMGETAEVYKMEGQ